MDGVRDSLRSQIAAARAESDALFAMLDPAALYERPIDRRHRIVFYIGHLESFDWNTLCRDALGMPSHRPAWDELFAAGIDPLDGGLPADLPSDWPAMNELKPWLANLRADVDRAIETAPLEGWLEDGWLVRLLAEHRDMHAETLCYMWHRMPGASKRGTQEMHKSEPRENAWIEFPEGDATLGQARARVGWDNEYDPHTESVPAFSMQRDPVSNADWLRFLNDGGYRDRSLWSEEDWAWRSQEEIAHPAFWRREGERWLWRGMFADIPLPLGSPVFVSHAEARAYARSLGGELPSEAQWHRAAADLPEGNFDFRSFDPMPTGSFGTAPSGVCDLQGNGWEWTRTVFAPFPGFTPQPFYPRYSAGFFDGKHVVMKGGSMRTSRALMRPSFRNWFQSHYPYVYAKLRVVKS